MMLIELVIVSGGDVDGDNSGGDNDGSNVDGGYGWR